MTLFLLMIAAAFGLLCSTAYYPYIFLAAGAVVYIYRAVRAIKNKSDPALYAIQGGILACFILYWSLREYSSIFYIVLNNISLAFSGAVGWIISRPIAMGMTYSGIDLVVLFIIASAALDCVRADRRRMHFALDALVIIFVWAFYAGFWTVLAENSVGLGLNLVEPLTGPLDFRYLLFAMLAAAYSLRHGSAKLEPKANSVILPILKTRRRRVGFICAQALLVVICASVLLARPAAPRATEGRKVVFWDTGIDFSTPQKGIYGLDRVGMFGALPFYLENRGYICEIVRDIDTGVLENAAALVVINPLLAPSEQSVAAVEKFVRNGGGVLAVGDHTGDEQIRKPLNKLLAPAGITFNFDSAIPFQSLWPQAFTKRKNPIFTNITDRQLQIVVGASLTCAYKAKPLLIGKTGFSDAGDITNETDGYLGDMSFSRGERFGDLILVAESRLGKGGYLAFGDTTPLQNTVLAYSAPFIDNIFAYLADNYNGQAVEPDAAELDTAEPDAAELDAGESARRMEKPESDYEDYCLIEASRIPGFSFDKSGNAADGLYAGVLRAGMLPYLNINESVADALNGGGRNIITVVITEPALPYDEADIASLNNLLDRGGTLVLLGHYSSPGAAKSLFARFGAAFDELPIGRIAPTSNPEMAFWNACPVLLSNARGTETLLSIWDYPVICRASVSNGEIIVIGDAGFLKNKNLEGVDDYRAGNVVFVEEMLERAKEHYYESASRHVGGGMPS